MNSVKLIFNTNSEWGRSGNPGAFARIFYNVGYLKYSDGWGYQSQLDADRDFEETYAHEIGHTILKSYGNTVYSCQHRGNIVAYPDKTRTVASEKDVLGLLWLTKMIIIK